MTVVGWNHLQESDEFLVTFEMVGQVRGLVLSDNEEVTKIDEVKWFYLDFESLGATTCIHMDYADGVQKTYGDEYYCKIWMPEVEYEYGVVLEMPVMITHTF